MRQWIKLEFTMITDERVKALIDDLGMKGLGIYTLMRLQVECNVYMPLTTLAQLISAHTSRRVFNMILNDYDLFKVDANSMVRMCVPAAVRESVPATVHDSVHGDTDAVHCSEIKRGEESVTPAPAPVRNTDEDDRFIIRMRQNYPNVMSMQRPLEKFEYDKLVVKFGEDRVAKTIKELENRKDVDKRYVSAYLTLLSWCEPK